MPSDASQPVDAPLSRSAIFITLTVNRGDEALETLRDFCADLPSLVKAVSFRSPPAGLSCIIGLGADLWQRLAQEWRPRHLDRIVTREATLDELIAHQKPDAILVVGFSYKMFTPAVVRRLADRHKGALRTARRAPCAARKSKWSS